MSISYKALGKSVLYCYAGGVSSVSAMQSSLTVHSPLTVQPPWVKSPKANEKNQHPNQHHQNTSHWMRGRGKQSSQRVTTKKGSRQGRPRNQSSKDLPSLDFSSIDISEEFNLEAKIEKETHAKILTNWDNYHPHWHAKLQTYLEAPSQDATRLEKKIIETLWQRKRYWHKVQDLQKYNAKLFHANKKLQTKEKCSQYKVGRRTEPKHEKQILQKWNADGYGHVYVRKIVGDQVKWSLEPRASLDRLTDLEKKIVETLKDLTKAHMNAQQWKNRYYQLLTTMENNDRYQDGNYARMKNQKLQLKIKELERKISQLKKPQMGDIYRNARAKNPQNGGFQTGNNKPRRLGFSHRPVEKTKINDDNTLEITFGK